MDNVGGMAESVDYHSRIKHKFIETYFNIWTDRVANPEKGKKNKGIPSLEIYDLYAASGWCQCSDCEEFRVGEQRWEGSALLAARCITKYPNSTKLFLNSYSPDLKKCEENVKTLTESLEALEGYSGLKSKIRLISEPIEKAVEIAKAEVNRDFPSIWLLDPYEPKQLPWEVVEQIGSIEGRYQINGKPRRPELIINFMTSYLQRFADIQPEALTVALGIEQSIWEPRLREYSEIYGNRREALLRMLYERLGELYEKTPIAYLVRDTTERAIVYCLILCTDHDAGHFTMRIHELPKLERWVVEEWRPTARALVKRKSLGKEQTTLDV